MHCIAVTENMTFSSYNTIGICGVLRIKLEIMSLLREACSLNYMENNEKWQQTTEGMKKQNGRKQTERGKYPWKCYL